MKRVLIILAIILLCGLSHAQIPEWQWASKADAFYNEFGSCIGNDAAGNSYVSGNFGSNATYPAVFGTTSLVSLGGSDIFVAKLDPNGNWLWAIRAGGTGDDMGKSLVLDNAGNIYLTGAFRGNTVIGDYTFTCSGDYDVFVAKLDPNGNWLWVTRAGGTGPDVPESIALDSSGNSYISGYFSSTAGFGATNLISAGSYDFFISKLDANGNWLWARRGGGSAAAGDVSECISVDANGNCYATGYFRGLADFGPSQITSVGAPDLFVVKLDTNGNWLWVKAGNSSAYGAGKGIVTDAAGNCFVSGYFSLNSTFGTQVLTSSGNSDIFVAQLDPNGNWQWAVRAGGTVFDSGDNIVLDNNGKIHVSGYFNGTATLGDDTLVSLGQKDIFTAKLDAEGNWIYAVRAGGNSYDDCYGMSVDSSGNTFLIGTSQGTVYFGTHTLVNPNTLGYTDIFVAKLIEIAQPLPPANLVLTVSGNDLVLQWDATTSNTSSQPVITAYYNVYWLDSLSGTYNVSQTTSLSWTHPGGALLSPKFYYVTAVVAD